ncbi:substrate-binding domain-containing protein [Jhaorihella thermophila]
MSFLKLAVSTLAVAAVSATAAAARDQIRIVGSSTVFPFSTAVAEQFGRTTDFKTPVVESTGSGGGMKLFCAGVGQEHPDITNASRRMKAGEFKMCQEKRRDRDHGGQDRL